jgi:acyl carrier protein
LATARETRRIRYRQGGHTVETIINDYITRELVQDAALLPLGDATSLLETGILHSLSMLRLAVFLRERFRVTVEDADLIPENFDSVDAICAYLRVREGKEASHAGVRG